MEMRMLNTIIWKLSSNTECNVVSDIKAKMLPCVWIDLSLSIIVDRLSV